MAGKRKIGSSDELHAARDEAQQRCDARDLRELQRSPHEERVRPLRDALGVAISELDAAFPRAEDGRPNPLQQQVSQALVTALIASSPPPPADTHTYTRAESPSPSLGPSQGLTPSELETRLEQAERGGDARNVRNAERYRAILDDARAAGVTDESVLAERAQRVRDGKARIAADIEALRADHVEWRMAPSRRAQPGESLHVVTARVLVEQGRTPFEATRMVWGLSSDEAKDSPQRKAVGRAAKEQHERAAPPKEMSSEESAEWDRVISESPRRSR